MKNVYILLLASILFFGCEKVVDSDKLLDTDEKVYISGYIAPTDTLLRVSVSKALAAIGTPLNINDFESNENLFLIKDALVQISNEEGNSVNLTYSDQESTYIAEATNFSILEGKQYFLKVITNGEEFNASCKIPKRVESITESILKTQDEFGNSYTSLKVGFPDILGARNFYVLGGFFDNTFEGETYRELLYFESFGLLTDAVEDGIVLSAESGYFLYGEIEEPQKVMLQVANVEEIIYQNLQASKLNSYNDGNPFIEYSISPDNIEEENGIGVFAGYQLTDKVVDIDE